MDYYLVQFVRIDTLRASHTTTTTGNFAQEYRPIADYSSLNQNLKKTSAEYEYIKFWDISLALID